MLIAAFTSRSCSVPHSGHTHDLTLSGMRPILWPHSLQVLLVGSNLPHLSRWTPYHSHLYSSILKNSDHDTSEMDLASLWFPSIPFTFRSSTAIAWFSRISLVLNSCRNALLSHVSFSYSWASLRLVALYLLEPFLWRAS